MNTEPITITPDFVWPEPDADGIRIRILANGAAIEQSAVIGRDTAIEPHAIIEQGAVIEPHAVIRQYAIIEPHAVIGRGARIEQGARIGQYARIGSNAVIRQYAVIGSYARIGSDAVIGSYAVIGQYAVIGHNARVGPNARWIACVGFADGYYKDLCAVGDVAYIGAGCRWFTLGAALRHWGNHPEERHATMALMEGAKVLATLNNLKWE